MGRVDPPFDSPRLFERGYSIFVVSQSLIVLAPSRVVHSLTVARFTNMEPHVRIPRVLGPKFVEDVKRLVEFVH